MPIIPDFLKAKAGGCKFEASLENLERTCLKIKILKRAEVAQILDSIPSTTFKKRWP